jgi:N12 class adenine-specific DNA methylase
VAVEVGELELEFPSELVGLVVEEVHLVELLSVAVEVEDKMTINLSKRVIILPNSNDFDDELKTARVLLIKDIKEFIRELKNIKFDYAINPREKQILTLAKEDLIKEINKLAGKDLTREVDTKWI